MWRGAAPFAAVVLLAIAGCAGQAPAPQPPVTVTVQAPAPSPAPATSTPNALVSTEPSAPPKAAEPSATESTFAMPDVVGTVLQDAQDRLQSLGSYLMDQRDASGLGRLQVLDSNWKVCAQDPAPGTVAPISTLVTLDSVKLSETCP